MPVSSLFQIGGSGVHEFPQPMINCAIFCLKWHIASTMGCIFSDTQF